MHIKDLVKNLSEDTGMTQTVVAGELNIAQGTLSTMLARDAYKDETGYGMGMKVDTLMRICHAFGYDVVVQPAGQIRNDQYVIGSPAEPKPRAVDELKIPEKITHEELLKMLD